MYNIINSTIVFGIYFMFLIVTFKTKKHRRKIKYKIIKWITSQKKQLIKQDLIKIGKGFLIAISGAVIALLTDISGMIDFSIFGEFAPYVSLAVASLASTAINAIRKWVSENEY